MRFCIYLKPKGNTVGEKNQYEYPHFIKFPLRLLSLTDEALAS